MNSNMGHISADQLRRLEEAVQDKGGNLMVCNGADYRCLIIDGDRAGLMRFALAILRYASEAIVEEGHSIAEVKDLREYFPSSSHVTDLFIQLTNNPQPWKEPKSFTSRLFGFFKNFCA